MQQPSETRDELRSRVLKMLNQLVATDPWALHRLAEHRVPVTNKVEELADNDTVVFYDNGNLSLGLIGIINGILGNEHRINGFYGDDGRLIEFQSYEVKKEEATTPPLSPSTES